MEVEDGVDPVDQLSASALRACGSRCSITPAIDRLAGAGLVSEVDESSAISR